MGAALSIPLQPVESSQIHSLGYDPATSTLAIRFKNRTTGEATSLYHYRNVSPELFEQFRTAESIGSFFIRNIKPMVIEFPYTRIESAPAPA